MKRYKVCCKNAKECQIELTFPDLCIRYSNGFSPALKVKEGMEIPLDVCDSEDIRKSWKVGSLRGYLENKWIEEMPEDTTIKESPTPISQFITEQMVLAPKVEPAKLVEQPKQEILPLPQSNLPEVAKVVGAQLISVPQVEAITDLSLVKTFEDFNRLSHFLKLRWIKESLNINLLKEISGKTPSSQFRNNITLRLTQVQTTKE